MPSFLRLALFILSLVFDMAGIFYMLRPFHSAAVYKRQKQLEFCRNSRLGFLRDFAKFYYSLVIVAWTDEFTPDTVQQSTKDLTTGNNGDRKLTQTEFDIIVIGGGPGGSITATLLAENGYTVCLMEEGEYLPLQSAVPFTVQEMVQKYRNGGLTPALGKPKITYVEGRCIGGGSEINSGLYHRTPRTVLEHWKTAYNLKGIDDADLLAHFEACEKDVTVSLIPDGKAPKASLMLKKGADQLGWDCPEVPRWFSYNAHTDKEGMPVGQRQSMTQTFIPRFKSAGGNIVHNTRAEAIQKQNNGWVVKTKNRDRSKAVFRAKQVFISCGAIGTPALLQRSGLPGVYGKTLQVHPTVKFVALFDEEVNSANMGVPVHQVKEFASKFSFGCSISSIPYLQLAMSDHPEEVQLVDGSWKKMAIYYAMIVPEGTGTVKAIPYFNEPLVTYRLTENDLANLANALAKLAELLFAAGAKKLFPSITGMQPLTSINDIADIPQSLSRIKTNLMTIHLFSTCPMGENKTICTVDSYGKMHGQEGLYICDGSILPTAPGVNPQGSIMAFARRNVLKFIETNKRN